MDTAVKYRSDYENYPPNKVFYRKTVRYQMSHQRFVVPWQLENDKKKKNQNPDNLLLLQSSSCEVV